MMLPPPPPMDRHAMLPPLLPPYAFRRHRRHSATGVVSRSALVVGAGFAATAAAEYQSALLAELLRRRATCAFIKFRLHGDPRVWQCGRRRLAQRRGDGRCCCFAMLLVGVVVVDAAVEWRSALVGSVVSSAHFRIAEISTSAIWLSCERLTDRQPPRLTQQQHRVAAAAHDAASL